MSGETTITVVGNLTADPDIRYTAAGTPVATLTVASTPRYYDRNDGGWKDGDTLFMRCKLWRQMAEHAAETLTRGMRVVAQGRLQQHSFETKAGEKRSTMQVEVDEIGPSLRYATATVTKASRTNSGGGEFSPAGSGNAWSTSSPEGDPPF